MFLVVQALEIVVAFHRGGISPHGALYEVDILLFLTVVVGAVDHDGVKSLQVGFDIELRLLRHACYRNEH